MTERLIVESLVQKLLRCRNREILKDLLHGGPLPSTVTCQRLLVRQTRLP